MTDTWTAPWTPGLPQAHCAGCDTNVVACTLNANGNCAQCASSGPPRKRTKHTEEPALALFDADTVAA